VAEQPGLGFAGLLRQLRSDAGLTQEELAEAAGLSPRSVSDLERGIHRTSRKDTAVLLADALGLAGSAEELFVAAARGKAQVSQVIEAVRGARPQLLAAVIDSPYRGLAAFEERDAGFFFGREAATIEVLERMSRRLDGAGLLVISGVSGAGKSSLLRAGVLARIRGVGLPGAPGAASWPRVVLTPTRAPLDELAVRVAVLAGADAAAVRRGLEADPARFALTARQAARPHAQPVESNGAAAERDQPSRRQRLLVVVDQFEELFTQCGDEEQRRAFITALHAAASTGYGPDQAPAALVVLGVRADFEARCADYPQLAGPVQDRYLVTSMTERQLRMAIAEPAKKAGAMVDDDLVGVLLTEVRNGQPRTFGAGVLPLLSHALDQAWQCRTGQTVTLADYDRAGGIEGAVASSAQRTYDHLSPAQQAATRQVFLRLIATSPDGMDTADRATRAELTEGKSPAEALDVTTVLETFAAERLLTLAAGTVEISHEALLTAWPLLRDTWLAETHADRTVRTRLHHTAAEWAGHSHDPSYLYAGSLLQAATDTVARIAAAPGRYPPLSQIERDFLHASDRAHRRTVRRRRGLIAILTAMVLGLAAATIVAVRAQRQVTRQLDVVTSGLLASQSQLIGDANPGLSKLLSVAAWRLNPSSAARDAMLAAAARPGIAILNGASSVGAVAFSPEGRTLAAGGHDGAVLLWDVATHQVSAALGGTAEPVTSVVFSLGGKTLAEGVADGSVLLWNPVTHLAIGGRLINGHAGVSSVAFSRDGKTLAAGGNDGSVRLWDLATRRPVGSRLINGHAGVNSVAFSRDGKTLAVGSNDGSVRLWDMVTDRPIGGPLTGQRAPVTSVAFTPDGKTLASGSSGGTVWLWDMTIHPPTGTPLINGQAGPVSSVAFSPGGRILAIGSYDGSVWLRDVSTRQPARPVTESGNTVYSVAFSPDGKTLASGSIDGTVRLWSVATPSHSLGDTTNLVRYLCALAGRPLTRVEWARYLPHLPYQRVCP
jgi:transcriptional regulator with XRE-family HTH domain